MHRNVKLASESKNLRAEAELPNTCPNGRLLNKSNNYNYFEGVTVLPKLVIKQEII